MALSAEAGPSSLPERASRSPLSTFRQLNDALEAANSTIPVAIIHKKLKEALPVLKSVYKQKRTLVVNERKTNLDESLNNVAKQCAILHQAEESEMKSLLRLYLDSEDVRLDLLTNRSRSTSRPLMPSRSVHGRQSVAPGSEDINTQLIDALSIFYCEEQLYAIRCISALLRIGDDNYHDLHNIAEEILGQFLDQDFVLQCLARVETLCALSLSESVREVPRYSTFWSKHSVREQIGLLECVFLAYYSRLESSAKFVEKVHGIIQSTNFGQNHSCAGFFDAEATSLLDNLSYLLILLAIESLDIEKLVDGDNFLTLGRPSAEEDTRRQLIDAPEIVEKVIDYLRSSTTRDHLRGPLLIGWALFVSRVDGAVCDWTEARGTERLPKHLQALNVALEKRGGAGSLWPELVSAALSPELGVFSTLNNLVKSPLIRWDARSKFAIAVAPSSSLAMRAVTKGFVLSINELVKPEYISDYMSFINVWQTTFANDDDVDRQVIGQATDGAAALCAQFWEVDYQHEQRRALLDTATRRFPVSFRPLVRLCKALSGSSPGALHTSDEAFKASTAVYNYLAEVQTITHVLNASSSLSAPFEVINDPEDPSKVVHRAKKTIPVFGRHLQIPAGAIGRMISAEDQAAIIMIWDISETPYSVWRLGRDVLAGFAGLLDRKDDFTSQNNNRSRDAAVFDEKAKIASFASLAPDESQTFDGDVAADIMDLFASILSTESRVAVELIVHLEGNDIGTTSIAQSSALDAQKPTLISITTGILNQALSSPSSASRVIISSYRLLTFLISATQSQGVWPSLRSSGLLIGSHGVRSLLTRYDASQSIDSSTLLAHETSIGKYAGLLSLLNLHHALLADVLQTTYSLSQVESEVKVDVILRSLRFITDQIWLEYQGWKYVNIRQRIEIGRKCVQIYQRILDDETLRFATTSSNRIYHWIVETFVSQNATALMLSPLINAIGSSIPFIHGLQRSSRQIEVELAREHIEACLRFTRTIIDVRREAIASMPASHIQEPISLLGLLERVFLGESVLQNFNPSATMKKRKLQSNASTSMDSLDDKSLANALFQLVFTSHSLGSRIEAVRLVTTICGSISDAQRLSTGPPLVSRLGSVVDMEDVMTNLIDLVEDSDQDDQLRAFGLNMLSALVKSQPGIATLLLTGQHVVDGMQSDEKGDSAEKESPVNQRTGVQVAAKLVEDAAKNYLDVQADVKQLRILQASLKFLESAWSHIGSYQKSLGALRQSKNFWNAIIKIATEHDVILSPTEPGSIEVEDGVCRTDRDGPLGIAASIKACSALALQLIAADLSIPLLPNKTGNSKLASLEGLLELLKSGKKFEKSLQSVFGVEYDPFRQLDVTQRIEATFPELLLEHFRLPVKLDENDDRRQYGCQYVYNLETFRFKLDGLIRTSIQSGDLDHSMIDTDANLQATILVAGVNLNWSAIDAQSMVIRAWTNLLSVAIGSLYTRFDEDKTLARQLRSTIANVWLECSKIVNSEEAGNEIAQDMHGLRVALLAVLLDVAWTHLPLSKNDLTEEDKTVTLSVMDQVVGLFTHPVLSVIDIMKKAALHQETSLHRDIARINLLTMQRYRFIYRQSSAGSKDGSIGRSELLRSLKKQAEALNTQTITFTRITLDKCLSLLDVRRTEVGDEYIDRAILILNNDLQLFLSGLAIQLHQECELSVHSWSPRLHSSALLSAAFDLFSRSTSPVHHLLPAGSSAYGDSDNNGYVDELGSGLIPAYWDSLLQFFLELACQPTTAEVLILAGATNALNVNAISLALDHALSASRSDLARIPPRLENGSTENALYVQWVKMLRILVALMNSLDTVPRSSFVGQEVMSFFNIYHSAIDHSFQRPLFQATSTMGMRAILAGTRQFDNTRTAILTSETITVNQLHEMDLIFNIYHHILQHIQENQRSDLKGWKANSTLLINKFVKRATLRLQECVHLLQHPHELLALLGLEEKQKDVKQSNHKSTIAMATRLLMQTSINIVKSFWALTNGMDTLCSSDASLWNLDHVLMVPTIGTSPSRPSSIGTLLDLAGYLTESLERFDSSKGEVDDKSALVAAMEQTVSLASTQLGLAMHGRSNENPSGPTSTTKKVEDGQEHEASTLTQAANVHSLEVEVGLGRDVCQSSESAKAAIQGCKESTAYLDIILAFQGKWLISSE